MKLHHISVSCDVSVATDEESVTGDVLGQMLLARDEDGQGLNDTELRDEVMTLMLAGHEVSSKLRVLVISDIEAIMS